MAESPLTDRHLNELNAAIKQLDEADKLLRMAVSAGLDVGDQVTQSRQAREQLVRIKSVFFPGK